METKAGYVAIVGKPNTGKSTLMNTILSSKLSIVTPKAQTTRKRVIGIYTDENNQIVFIDNPGLLKPNHNLHHTMLKYIDQSLDESEIVVLLFDATKFENHEQYFAENFIKIIENLKKPVIAVLNKSDLIKSDEILQSMVEELNKTGIYDNVLVTSALNETGIPELINSILIKLPFSEFYYDPELLSTQPQRFFVSEIIREHVFNLFSEEVPYSTEIQIAEFKERESGKWFISADIIVEKQSQKGIIIGKGGAKIKELGEKSRHDIEDYLDLPVYLNLFVKVREQWRKKSVFLKSFGY